MSRWLVVMCTLIAGQAWANPYAGGSSLLAPEPAVVTDEAEPFTWEADTTVVQVGRTATMRLTLHVPPGHQVYRDAVKVQLTDGPGLALGRASLPPGEKPTREGEEDRLRYTSDTVIDVPLRAAAVAELGVRPVELTVSWQGCRPGLCWPVRTETIFALVRVIQ